jgi:hypothetical protein
MVDKGKTMEIELKRLDIKDYIFNKDQMFYRVTENKQHTFQSDDSTVIKEGRFNHSREYCFYIATSPEAALSEKISHCYNNQRPNPVFIKTLRLKNSIKLADLRRWIYLTKDNLFSDFSEINILINQYIDCPKKDWSNWLYADTQLIADFFRKNDYDGILYQTVLSHYDSENIIFKDPKQIFNIALFKDPKSCMTLFAEISNMQVDGVKYSNYEKIYQKNLSNDDRIKKSIFAKNSSEIIHVIDFNNPTQQPSLTRYTIRA